MGLFGYAARRFLDRASGGRRVRRSYGAPLDRPRRGRFGLWGPVPYYSRRTRRGAEVSVGGCGCCLPIPLLAVVGTAGGLRAVWRRVR